MWIKLINRDWRSKPWLQKEPPRAEPWQTKTNRPDSTSKEDFTTIMSCDGSLQGNLIFVSKLYCDYIRLVIYILAPHCSNHSSQTSRAGGPQKLVRHADCRLLPVLQRQNLRLNEILSSNKFARRTLRNNSLSLCGTDELVIPPETYFHKLMGRMDGRIALFVGWFNLLKNKGFCSWVLEEKGGDKDSGWCGVLSLNRKKKWSQKWRNLPWQGGSVGWSVTTPPATYTKRLQVQSTVRAHT